MSWKNSWIESFSSEMLERLNARSSKYQVHSARAHITVSFVHNGGRNMLRNLFLAPTKTVYIILWTMNIFLYISRQHCLENVLNMHTQLQRTESILKVVWIFNHRNKLITKLHLQIIFISFLNNNLKAMRWQSTWCTDS